MKYFEELKKSMNYLAEDNRVVFLGQAVRVPGTAMSTTLKEVNNKIQISDVSNVKNLARDIASVGEIRAKLLANSEINSLNFSIDVVNNAAYLSGIASSQNEMNLVTNIAQGARFVKEVFNYIKINPDKR